MLAPDQIWASAKAGRVYSFDGTTWSEQTLGNRDLRDVCFISPDKGYMVGRNGTLATYDGTVWQLIASGTANDMNSVYILDETSGYLVGNSGTVISFQGEGFNSPYLKSFSVGSDISELQFSNLAFGKNHYFRMRARHNAATSEWSPANSFAVIAFPNLKTPANNASNISLDTTFKWDEITGIVKYNVQLADNPEFTNPLLFETSTNEYRVTGLGFGKDYYWRLNARHAADVSDWSPAFKLTTTNSITLTFPANNAEEVVRLPRYDWNGIIGAEKYQIQVSKNNDFTNSETNISNASFYQQVFLLDKEQTYFWRVKGIQGLDSTNWSPVWSFVTTGETSIDENIGFSFKMYPNPASEQFTIKFIGKTNTSAKMEIYNIIGSKVYENEFEATTGENNQLIEISMLERGVYLIKLIVNDEVYTQRLVKE